MKKIILFAAGLIILSVSSKRPKCCIPPNPEVVTAQRNGAAWQAYIAKSILKNDTITLATRGTVSPTDVTPDSLFISFKYTETGSYKLTGQQAVYIINTNSTTQQNRYILDSSYNNTINIDNYQVLINQATSNPDPTEIKGTFNLRFTGPDNASSVSLLNGKFTALLPN